MPDTVERTIYKLELDDSGYIKGVESLAASTNKLTSAQEAANKKLAENEAQLKKSAEVVAKHQKALESYTGADKAYKAQLEANLKTSQASHTKLTELVDNVRKGYEKAKKSADDFANASQKANNIQQSTTGGKIPIAPPPGIVSPISQGINLTDVLPQTKTEFDQLAVAIENAETHLNELNTESQEFKTIKPVVDQAKVALQQYADVTDDASNSTLSIRGQLRQAKEELVRLEQAGKGASKEYLELEKRTARLTDAFNDQQARIRILASDTKLLDFGKGAITAATSAFQTYASVSILVGDESAELQKKTMQLFAAMQLLQSLEQLSNLTRREGIIGIHLQSASQAVYTSVVGASTGALKAFRIALLGTGILAAAVLIGLLVKKYLDWKDSIKEVSEEQKLLNDVRNKAIEGYAKEVSRLEVLRIKLSSTNTPQKERIALAKEYNKTADEGNKIDLKQIDNITLLNATIDKQIVKIKERAKAQAAANVTTEAATKLFQAEQKLSEVNETLILDLENIDAQIKTIESSFNSATITFSLSGKRADQQLVQSLGNTLRALKDIKKANEDFTRAARLTATLPETEQPKGVDTKATREIENVFARTLRELLARLRAASKEEFQSVDIIQQEFTNKLFDEIDKIDDLVSKKQLTAKQGGILTKILEKIIGKEADKSISDFKKKVETAINKLQDELNDIQNKANIDSINLLQDEFDRRAKLIDANEQIELDNAKDAVQDRLDALELDRLLIGEQAYQDAKAVIIATGEQNALNITASFGQQRQDLAADIFKKSLDNINKAFEEQILQVDEITAGKIQSEKALFQAGTISYDEYQKRITKILKDQKDARDKLRLQELTTELNAINKRLETATTAAEKEDLQSRQRAVRNQIAELNSQTDVEDPNKKKKDSLADYAAAVGQLSDSVISFWQKANEAEATALDRSISLQEKRVEAAIRIAARGNAEYLKQEEDRLKELQVKREAAARKQLGIDAALQASQVLVGITGAISRIAASPFGAETIAEIAIIIGALATGYGIVKSLQGNQPKLAKGDPYVKRGNNPAGVDTIPAWLNEGEAVIPADKNKAYHQTVRAIYDGTVPAEALNNFVRTHHKIKSVPQVDYTRIEGVAQLSIGQDGKMVAAIAEQNRLIMENTDVQRAVLRKIERMGVNVSLDQKGFAVTQMEVIDQMEKDKHT